MLKRIDGSDGASLPLAAVDISGKWQFTVDTDAGSGSPTFVFKQDGEKLSGTYSGLFGTAQLTGTVKGDAIEFSFEAAVQDQKEDRLYGQDPKRDEDVGRRGPGRRRQG